TFHTADGVLALRDVMPVTTEAEKRAGLVPEHEILREVEGLQGEVSIEVEYAPLPHYRTIRPSLQECGPFGLRCEIPGATLSLLSDMPLQAAADRQSAHGVTSVRCGERVYLSLTYSEEAPAVIPVMGDSARDRFTRSDRWWRHWADRCTYHGPYRDA